MTGPAEKIAAAVLYEGYLLWPYRRSAKKNQKRWTFGGVYPRAYSEAGISEDPWWMQIECLVTGTDPIVTLTVRFLQIVDRQVVRKNPDGSFEYVDALQIGETRYLTWEEATEREIAIDGVRPASLDSPHYVPLEITAGRTEEYLQAPNGELIGTLVRRWHSLSGAVEIGAAPVQDGVFKMTVKLLNFTPWNDQDRDTTLKHTFISTHAVLSATGGAFVSLIDPPEPFKKAAEKCENIRSWPVLVGNEGETRTMLCSPIILYDYPQIAPESPGDLFDGTEIDQLLLLNILALTDEEKEEMRASDPRAREILARCEGLGPSDFLRLHGAIREFRLLREEHTGEPLWECLERPRPERVSVAGLEIRKGSKVRLRPRPGGDIFDLALAGKVAVVESIEQDYDDRIHVTVTLEEDPGRDLAGIKPGHRFFFAPEEIEPLDGAQVEESKVNRSF